uniref:Trihelix transcription factor ASR3 n=1 Tax=Elaeis guineensis var. tenera TaxID=51953 RepID=A0A6I9QRM7_ELAGV|nr:trihelix transcription factor ASR3 [Elaeis guineensis]
MERTETPCIVQALPASNKKDKESLTKPVTVEDKESPSKLEITTYNSPQTPSSSRFTRSQAAPDWTTHEMLVLVSEIAAVDEDWVKALSLYQKWKMISDNCMAFDVIRSSNQCKRKWESLLADYRRIRDWESRHGVGSYWCLEGEKRKQFGLPAFFDEEVFDSMDAVIKAQETQSGSGDSDSEGLIGKADVQMTDGDADLGPEEKEPIETLTNTDKARDMAMKLQDDAQHIHAILKGELEGSASQVRAPVDLTKPNAMETEFTRRQANELIKAFGSLVSTLNQFTELIKDGECEGIKPVTSTAQ